jgi:hypothetical protein
MAVAHTHAQDKPATTPTNPTTPVTTPVTPVTPITPATPLTPINPATPGAPLNPTLLPAIPTQVVGPTGTVPGGRLPTPIQANDEAFNKAAAETAIDGEAVIDGPTVTLGEALRITLMQSPAIKLAQEDMEIARGTLQSSIGAFDTHVVTQVDHGQTVKQLTDKDIFKDVKT